MKHGKTPTATELEVSSQVPARLAGITKASKKPPFLKDFYSIFDGAPTGIAVLDLAGVCLEVNQALCEMLGYAPEELLQTSIYILIHPDGLPACNETLQALRQGLMPNASFEKRCLHKDGSIIWAQVSISLHQPDDAEPHFIAHVFNISQRKAVEDALVLQHALLAAQSEASPDGILLVSEEREWLYTNQRFCDMWEIPDQVAAHKSSHLALASIRDKVIEPELFIAKVEQLYQNPEASSGDEVLFKDGRVFDLHSSPIKDPQGHYVGRIWHYRNVTAKAQSLQALRDSEERFKQLTEAAFEAIAVSADGLLTEVNDNFCTLFGYDREELIGTSMVRLSPESEHASILAKVHNRYDRAFELTCLKKDQSTFIAEVHTKALKDSQGRDLRVTALADITERKRLEAKLHYDAFHDSLTGLKNRAAFSEQLAHTHHYHQRYPEARFAVLFIDLDRFKPINDTYGHAIGDRILVAVARRLQACVRTTDTVARIGGDEFVLLLRDVDNKDDASEVAANILASLNEDFVVNDISLQLSASIGIALSSSEEAHPDYLIRNADAAMYQAKHQGKNRLTVFEEPMRVASLNLLKLESDLKRAFELEDLMVYYQPIVNLASQRIVACEALLRWTKADGTEVSPAEFIPLAEDSGLIHALGKWVLSQACQQLKLWQQECPDLTMHVNLSVKQLSDPELIAWLSSELARWDLEPAQLCLEITESLMLSGFEASAAVLEQLYELGVQLQIDDFGTGYSSLAYLHSFPVHALKIDRSFVMRLKDDPKVQNIIQTILTLAQALGLEVIAEGIEAKNEHSCLHDLGCHMGQGYFFSKALPASEISFA